MRRLYRLLCFLIDQSVSRPSVLQKRARTTETSRIPKAEPVESELESPPLKHSPSDDSGTGPSPEIRWTPPETSAPNLSHTSMESTDIAPAYFMSESPFYNWCTTPQKSSVPPTSNAPNMPYPFDLDPLCPMEVDPGQWWTPDASLFRESPHFWTNPDISKFTDNFDIYPAAILSPTLETPLHESKWPEIPDVNHSIQTNSNHIPFPSPPNQWVKGSNAGSHQFVTEPRYF